jgi:hypothetical protein
VSQNGVFNPRDYGAVGNESIATTGSMASGSSQLTVATSNGSTTGFSVGNYLTVKGAGAKTVPGSIAAGSNQLTLPSSAGFTLDTYVRVAGAGAGGSLMFAQIRDVVGNMLTLSENAGTTVSDANVTNDGVLYDAKITAIAGNVLTLDRTASATVSGAVVKIDDHPAFVACLEDMRAQVNPVSYGALWYGSKVVVPPGVKDPKQSTGGPYGFGHFGYRMSRPLHITSCCIFEGTSGYHWPSTILHFDPGVTGVIFDAPNDRGLPHNHARADGTILRQIGIVGSATLGPVESLAGGFYQLPWQPGKTVVPGDVRVPSTYRQNLWGKAIMCLTGGTTATSYLDEPNWNSAGGDAGIYTESTGVVWKLIDCDGILMQAPGKIADCFIYAFSGNGVNYQALGHPQAIANNSKIVNNRIVICGGNGIRANGNDANQGHIEGNDSSRCYGYGFVDTSLLSNIWVSNHGAECLRGAAWFDHGRVLFHYAEGGQGPIHLTQNSAWVHGVAGAGAGDGFDSVHKLQRGKVWSTGAVFAAGAIVYPTVDNGYFYWTSTGGTTAGTEPVWPLGRGKSVTDGTALWYCYGPSAVQQGLSILHQNTLTPTQFNNHGGQHRMRFDATTINADEYFAWKCGIDSAGMTTGYSLMGPDSHHYGWQTLTWNRGGLDAQAFCLSTQRAVDNGTAVRAGMLEIPNAFYLGSPYYSRILQHVGTAPPTTSAWLRGSFMWNAAPDANGLQGWECVAAGTPGTWVPVAISGGLVVHNMTSDASYTLSTAQKFASIVEITDTGALLTTTRSIILPTWAGMERTVYNGTAQTLVFTTQNGNGFQVYPNERRQVYCDGTNVVAVG